jgi:hypothetical protein
MMQAFSSRTISSKGISPNMMENPEASLTWREEKIGFRIEGTVTNTDGGIWRRAVAWLMELRPGLKPEGAVDMTITDVCSVVPGTEHGKKIL